MKTNAKSKKMPTPSLSWNLLLSSLLSRPKKRCQATVLQKVHIPEVPERKSCGFPAIIECQVDEKWLLTVQADKDVCDVCVSRAKYTQIERGDTVQVAYTRNKQTRCCKGSILQ